MSETFNMPILLNEHPMTPGICYRMPGTFQDEVGCESVTIDSQGDGIYTITLSIPAGDYEYKVAIPPVEPEGILSLEMSRD